MKTELMMDFSIDKASRTVTVTREFAAPLQKVWAAWTQAELLDQWWAPKPWQSRTKSMDFKEGGRRLYAMVGPEGEEHWALADYESIQAHKSMTFTDAFCDSEGKVNPEFPSSTCHIEFSEANGRTSVFMKTKYAQLSDLEMVISMGFQEGFTMALKNLDEVLSA